MNARLYDPVVGRFLSPDPYVQAPDFSQNFNRYSYGLNNPLRYTDPNGEFILSALAAAFCPPLLPFAIYADAAWMGAAINVYSNWDNITDGGGINWNKLGSYAGFGIVSGVGIASGNFWLAAGAQFIQGAGNDFVTNGKLTKNSFISGGISTASYTLTAGLTSGIPGLTKGLGLDSKLSNTLVKGGFNKVVANYAGEYIVNYGVSFTFGVGDAVYSGKFDWEKITTDAFWSSNLTLAISVVKNTSPSTSKNQSDSHGKESDRVIHNAQNEVVETPTSSPRQQPKTLSPNPQKINPNNGGSNKPINRKDMWNKLNQRK